MLVAATPYVLLKSNLEHSFWALPLKESILHGDIYMAEMRVEKDSVLLLGTKYTSWSNLLSDMLVCAYAQQSLHQFHVYFPLT